MSRSSLKEEEIVLLNKKGNENMHERVRVTYTSFTGDTCALADMLWCRSCARLVAYDSSCHAFPSLQTQIQMHTPSHNETLANDNTEGDNNTFVHKPATATEIDR